MFSIVLYLNVDCGGGGDDDEVPEPASKLIHGGRERFPAHPSSLGRPWQWQRSGPGVGQGQVLLSLSPAERPAANDGSEWRVFIGSNEAENVKQRE